MILRLLLFTSLMLTAGCPKKEIKSLDEIEKEERLRELFEEEEEIFDDLPEAGEDDVPRHDPETIN